MSHHGSSFLDGFSEEQRKAMFEDTFKKSMPAEQSARINDLLAQEKTQMGATGKFPDGKITENDEGEIQFGITAIEDRVVLNFNTPVHWIGFTRAQALAVANSLTKHAASIPAR